MNKPATVASALTAACALGSRGFACFPVLQDKRPACPHGFQDATLDRDRLEELWRQFPGQLVGVATGAASNIDVLDVDAKHPSAHRWWIEHRDRLLPARVHRTRSGGLHLIFQHREGLRNSASKIARGVDTRGDGGFCVWWPCIGLPVLADPGIRAWPEWLMPLLEPAPAPLPISRRALAVRDGDLRPTLHRALGLIRTVALASEGTRNGALYWATHRARDMVVAGELDRAAGAQVLEALRGAAAHAGLTEREAGRTIASAMRAA
jgi:Bifunctional DNA primase/polymerase, N-terminal